MQLELVLCAWQAAWAANDYSVQDTLDHEVYKMIGRHGTSMVSRGIIAAGSLHAMGVAGKCAHKRILPNTYHEFREYNLKAFSSVKHIAAFAAEYEVRHEYGSGNNGPHDLHGPETLQCSQYYACRKENTSVTRLSNRK